MLSWKDFAQLSPEFAAEGEKRLDGPGVVLVGTVRRDGAARISPVEPMFLGGRLYLGMMWQSKKALDLVRDPRVLVHSVISRREGDEGEFKLRGRALDVSDPDERERYAQAVFEKIAWRPGEPYHLFAVDIEAATLIWYGNERKNITHWTLASGETRRWDEAG